MEVIEQTVRMDSGLVITIRGTESLTIHDGDDNQRVILNEDMETVFKVFDALRQLNEKGLI